MVLCAPVNESETALKSTAAFRTKEDKDKVQSVYRNMREKGIGPILTTLTERWFTDKFIKERFADVEFRLQQVLETDSEVFLDVEFFLAMYDCPLSTNFASNYQVEYQRTDQLV